MNKKKRDRRRRRQPAKPRDVAAAVVMKREPEPDLGGISEEVMTLAMSRGEEITRFPVAPGEKEKPVRRLGGLDWLWFKGRIDSFQMGAGLKYGDLYRLANDVSLRSSANMVVSGGDGVATLERRADSLKDLERARSRGLNGHTELIALCDSVAGEGRRVRELANNREPDSQRIEARLVVALDLLAIHYGMVK